MDTTNIPSSLADLIGVAAEMRGAILIYDRDVVAFADKAAQDLHHQQDWSAPVTFDGIFRTGIALGRINDDSILSDPEGHLAYAKMVRARERRHSFQRTYDGILYDRHHIGISNDWNAQIWVPAIQYAFYEDKLPSDLFRQVERNRSLAAMASILERMGIAMSVVAANGKLLDNSTLMKQRLRTGDLFERDLGNKIACCDTKNTDRLREMIAAVASGKEKAALIPMLTVGGTQLVAIMPAPTQGLAVVLVQGAAQPETLQELLVSAYDLTPRQAQVAVRVAAGETAEQISIALDRKLDTVRQQIVTSKAKIAAERQQDLACIITRAAALFGGISSPKSPRGMI